MQINYHIARTLFDRLNRDFFAENLPNDYELDIFTEHDMPVELGYCVDEEDGVIVLGLVEEFDSYDEITATLKHEMIHMEQIINNHPVNHGSEFMRKAKMIGASV